MKPSSACTTSAPGPASGPAATPRSVPPRSGIPFGRLRLGTGTILDRLIVCFRCLHALSGLHGSVRDAADGRPLPGVHVEVDGVAGSVTDSLGRYAAPGLAAGEHAVRFTADAYAPSTVTVFLADSADLELDVVLAARPVVLPEVEVSTAPVPPLGPTGPLAADDPEPGHVRFAPDWQASELPGRADAQSAMLSVPGVAARGEDGPALSVRGGSGADNLILLDGLPIYGSTHFAGARSAVTPEALGTLDLHTGVSSARFGGRLAGVAELETAEAPGALHLSSVAGPTEARATLRAPLGMGTTAGVLLSGRHSLRSPLSDESESPHHNEYDDLVGVVRYPLAGGTLRLVGFATTNRLAFDVSRDANREPASSTDSSGTTPSVTRNALAWRSGTGGANWSRQERQGGELRVSAWWAGTRTDADWVDSTVTERLRSRLDELGLAARRSAPVGEGTATVGLDLLRPWTVYRTTSGDTTADGLSLDRAPVFGSVFAEWERSGPWRLGVRGGVRATTDFGRRLMLDPRLTLTYRPWPGTRVGLGAGRTWQAVQSLYNEESIVASLVSLDLPVAAGSRDPVARADQLEAGIDQRVSDHLSVSATGYLRRWTGAVLPPLTTGALFVTDSFIVGDGRAAGLGLAAMYSRGRLGLRASAGLSRTVREAAGRRYHIGAEQPWSLAGDVAFRPDRRTVLQAGLVAGAGQPTSVVAAGFDWQPFQPLRDAGELAGTPVNLAGSVNPLRLPDFLRIDLGVRRRWPLHGLGSVGTAARLDNLLGRRNALGVVGGARALRFLPAAGRSLTFEVDWSF